MNIVVIGLGSMGRRRIRLTRAMHPDWSIVGIDLDVTRRHAVAEEFGIPVRDDLSLAVSEFNCSAALVCTSPKYHGSIVIDCIRHGLNVFMELNLIADWYQEAIGLAAQKNCRLFVSSSFLYRREIQYIAKFVQGQKVNYIYHSGQYLPDWHPWESYKDFFVAENKTNACREILAIELPWIISAFSPVESFHVMADRNSGLEIDFNDNYMISLQHHNGSKGVFCQDVISRKGLRRLEVYSENLHLFWEGTPQTLEIWDGGERKLKQVSLYDDVEQNPQYNSNIIEDMYKDELAAFFRYVEDGIEPSYSLADDSRTLALIDKIERAGNG